MPTHIDPYQDALEKLKKTKNNLQPDDVLLKSVNVIIDNIEEMNKKHNMSVAKLIEGLNAVDDVLSDVKNMDTNKLLVALEHLDNFKNNLSESKLKRNIGYFLMAVTVALVAMIIVLAAIHFPPALLIPIICFAMGTTAIPGIAGVIPALTVSNIVLNALKGVSLGLIKPHVWKYSRAKFRSWRYDVAVTELTATIAEKMRQQDPENSLACHAQTLLKEIQVLKTTGNQSKAVHKLTEALEAVNAALKNPTNIDHLKHVANIADGIPPVQSRLSLAYNRFLEDLAPMATLALFLVHPMIPLQNVYNIANAIAIQFLAFVVPYSGLGIGPDSTTSLIIIDTSISVAGEKAVEVPGQIGETTQHYVERIRSWLGYKPLDPAMEQPSDMSKALKNLKQGFKANKVKADVMRDKMQTFKEELNKVARPYNKPLIPTKDK